MDWLGEEVAEWRARKPDLSRALAPIYQGHDGRAMRDNRRASGLLVDAGAGVLGMESTLRLPRRVDAVLREL
jgi:hypothetical protein